jgi:hypothetical protein
MADSYSRAWQLGCATNILRGLPQEIRDMIYEQLLAPNDPRIPNDGGESHWRHSSFADHLHYFDKRFMGHEFVTELSQVFYSEKQFALRHPGELEEFFSRDRFYSGCRPYEHVRFITINVTLDFFSACYRTIRKWSSPKFGTPLKQHFLVALRGLENLKRLQKAAPTIRLRIDCREHDAGPKFAEVLFPLVYELKNKGCVVEIQGQYKHGQPGNQLTAIDFNYNIAKKDWNKKSKSNSAFVSPSNYELLLRY